MGIKRMNNDFYKRVDELCEKQGLSHRELAECIGVDQVTLSRYLTGERRVQLAPFMAMCKKLEVEPRDLYNTYVYASLAKRVADYRREHERKK